MLVEYWETLKNSVDGGTEVKTTQTENEKPSYWQRVFMQSKVNGAAYDGEALPGRNWDWPKNTYLQRRLHRAKFLQASDACKLN
jgi:hypothetical protein